MSELKVNPVLIGPDKGSSSMRVRWWNGWGAAGVLVLLHALLALSAAWNTTVTFDETAHLGAGLSYWTTEHRIFNPENGQLPQRVGALPLWLQGVRLPDSAQTTNNPGMVWRYGQDLLFGNPDQPAPPGQAEYLLRWARASMILLSMACGLLIYTWSRRLFNPTAGLVSLTLFTFCPTFLGHGPLVTSDVAAAFFFAASVGTCWRLLHHLSICSVLLTGLALGGLCLSKMSAPLMVPIILLMLAIRLLAGRPLILKSPRDRWAVIGRGPQALWLTGALLFAGLIAWGLIWSAYDFRFQAGAPSNPEAVMFDWPTVMKTAGFKTEIIAWAREHHLLPETFLYGFGYVLEWSRARNAFLNGEFSVTGWRSYFPLAFLMKSPLLTLGTLLLAVLAGVMTLLDSQNHLRPNWQRQLTRGLYRTAPLWLLIIVYGGMAVSSHINIGLRHVLPVYPAIYILAGAAGYWLYHQHRLLRTGTYIVLTVLALESTLAWPHYLSYFNQTVGGAYQGHKHLIDSNLDWGQDLPYIKPWLVEQGLDRPQDDNVPPMERVYLSYFGNGSISYYGIRTTLLPGYGLPDQDLPLSLPKLQPGVYIISSTMLSGTYFNPGVGPIWLPKYEHAYRSIWPDIAQFIASKGQPEVRQALIQQRGEQFWFDHLSLYRKLRIARLCAYLRERPADAQITPSYLVYVLTSKDVLAAEEFPGKTPIPIIDPPVQ